MHVVVVANGELPTASVSGVRQVLQAADVVMAADGGLGHCESVGVWPNVLIGDLDSVSPAAVEQAEARGVRIVEHPTDKDATDLELALIEALAAGASQITVVAPFGGRLDHELATIALLARSDWAAADVQAVDGRRQLIVIRSSIDLDLAQGETVSLIPWAGEVTGVTTEGLQWPLANATLGLGTTLGVSNVAVEPEQSVAITSGVLLAVADRVLRHL